jgi:hypothetical protein
MSWSPQQDAAIRSVSGWLADPKGPQVFRLFGYAGTGKTTLAKELAGTVKGKVLYATFTGKAGLVLRKKGCEGASTIHSLIYRVEMDDRTGITEFKLNDRSALADAALLIVDEVSMVGEDLARDLLSFGTRILVLGDPAQLPPVKGEGFFINAEPDAMLTEVHRQAQDNPIIRMSMEIREGKRLSPGRYGDSLITTSRALGRDGLGELVLGADQLLCGLNRTRTSYNHRMREMKGLRGADKPWHPANLPAQRQDAQHLQRRPVVGGYDRDAGRQVGGHRGIARREARPDQGRGFRRVLQRHRAKHPLAGKARHPGIHLRVGDHLPQVAGLSVGQRADLRRERFVPRGPQKLAVHGGHSRR